MRLVEAFEDRRAEGAGLNRFHLVGPYLLLFPDACIAQAQILCGCRQACRHVAREVPTEGFVGRKLDQPVAQAGTGELLALDARRARADLRTLFLGVRA